MPADDDGADRAVPEPVATRKAPGIGKSFSARNPLPIGAIGLVFLLLLLVAAFNVQSLPLIGGGTVYKARFNESANLKQGDEVRIAGVKVGVVQSVSISGTKVLVDFTVKNGWVGNNSTVYIKLKTLLGAKYLAIDSQGSAAQDSSKVMTHTYTPLDVYPAFTKLTDTVKNINTADLAKAFTTLADDLSNTPQYVRRDAAGRHGHAVNDRIIRVEDVCSRTRLSRCPRPNPGRGRTGARRGPAPRSSVRPAR